MIALREPDESPMPDQRAGAIYDVIFEGDGKQEERPAFPGELTLRQRILRAMVYGLMISGIGSLALIAGKKMADQQEKELDALRGSEVRQSEAPDPFELWLEEKPPEQENRLLWKPDIQERRATIDTRPLDE